MHAAVIDKYEDMEEEEERTEDEHCLPAAFAIVSQC